MRFFLQYVYTSPDQGSVVLCRRSESSAFDESCLSLIYFSSCVSIVLRTTERGRGERSSTGGVVFDGMNGLELMKQSDDEVKSFEDAVDAVRTSALLGESAQISGEKRQDYEFTLQSRWNMYAQWVPSVPWRSTQRQDYKLCIARTPW